MLGVLRAPAAGGAVERVDRPPLVRRDDAARLHDGLCRERIFGEHAKVHLAGVGRADVVSLLLVLPDVAVDVGARRHRLRLERFELTECGGIELVRDDAPQVILERQFVYDGEGAAAVAKNLQRAAVGARLDFER